LEPQQRQHRPQLLHLVALVPLPHQQLLQPLEDLELQQLLQLQPSEALVLLLLAQQLALGLALVLPQQHLLLPLEVLGLQQPLLPLPLEVLGLQLLVLQVLVLALEHLQQPQLQLLGALAPPQLQPQQPQLLGALAQLLGQSRLPLEVLELQAPQDLVLGLPLGLGLEHQQVLEQVQLALEGQPQDLGRLLQQGQGLELQQLVLRIILPIQWTLFTLLCFTVASTTMREIALLPGGTCYKHPGARGKLTLATLLPQWT